jgi:Phosphotransferase enzyme family
VANSPHTLKTNLSTIQWSDDGTRVTKRHDPRSNADKLGPRSTILDHHHARSDPWSRHFAYELRVNQLLTRHRPPVPTPRLLGHDRKTLTLEFEAIDGHRLGPKFPLDLSVKDLEGLIALATALRSYRHRPRWLRTLPIRSRLRRAARTGLLTACEYRALQERTAQTEIRWVFAHADINPSNVVVARDGLFVLDWEWAGLYPEGYDLAFLWFVLIDLPDARSVVESRIRTEPTAFWLSALIIELLHLEWFEGRFRPNHEATRDALVAKLLDRPPERR